MTIVPRQNSRKWLWLTLAITAVIVLIVQIPLLLEPEYVDEDLRFFYWLFRLADPSLFENDPLLGYQFAEVDLGFTTLLFNKVSLLYGALYALVSPIVSPFIFSKIIIFPLAIIGTYYLFQIVTRFSTPFVAFLISSIYTLIVAVPIVKWLFPVDCLVHLPFHCFWRCYITWKSTITWAWLWF
ncbi:MAG: hypothetical protein IPJ90_14550 [Anaerolineaceae bacterium]|nr:hypothetical protein [Anaerolineaceae bacterium]